jgi:hypothetical protein
MDLIDHLRALAAKIPKFKADGLMKTEEGTKNAMVMPFINALGYDVFNPMEVTPELIADVGTKKGEKVDYAVLKNGKPIILFECKIHGTNLKETHASQLYRYFTVTEARFGILTDGQVYRFYTDLVQKNIMDADPFFVIDICDFREQDLEQLKRFTNSIFDESAIILSASELKYKSLIKAYLSEQTANPSEGFIRTVLAESKAYSGRFMQTTIDEFRPIIKDALRLFISDQVELRLKSALARETAAEQAAEPAAEGAEKATSEQPIVTTQEEIEAFFAIKSVLHDIVDPKRLFMRDNQSYCSVLLDDNNRRPIVRIRFNTAQKHIGVFNEQRGEERIAINGVDDIYKHAERIKKVLALYPLEKGKSDSAPTNP